MTDCRTPSADDIACHRAALLRFARRRLRDAAQAEDLVQETLLAALQGAQAFAERAALRTWLTGILERRIADDARRRHRSPIVAVGTPLDSAQDDAPDLEAADWVDPARRLQGRQFIGALAARLAALPPLAARLFALREIDGASHAEASRAVGLSPQRASQLLHRTRISLRSGLARDGVAA